MTNNNLHSYKMFLKNVIEECSLIESEIVVPKVKIN